jgi:hypothetical protein
MDLEVAKSAAADDTLFIVISASTLFVIFVTYFWFVFYQGPKMMKDRNPYNVTNVIRYYNVFQVIACSIFVYRTYQMGFDFRFLWRCESFDFLTDGERLELKIGTWCFLLLRMFEFVETIFFILRKKDNQASFLHVYHHITVVLLMWVYITFDTELMAIYNASINSFVHIVMYTYYFLSSFKNIKNAVNIAKPVITIVQLVQFVLILGVCIIAILPGCGYSIFFHLQIANLCMLIILFGHFFIKNYLSKKN